VIADNLEGLVKQGQEQGVKGQHTDPDILSAIEIVITPAIKQMNHAA
jgi:hydroxylamine reductase